MFIKYFNVNDAENQTKSNCLQIKCDTNLFIPDDHYI